MLLFDPCRSTPSCKGWVFVPQIALLFDAMVPFLDSCLFHSACNFLASLKEVCEMKALKKEGYRSFSKSVKPSSSVPAMHKRSKRLDMWYCFCKFFIFVALVVLRDEHDYFLLCGFWNASYFKDTDSKDALSSSQRACNQPKFRIVQLWLVCI